MCVRRGFVASLLLVFGFGAMGAAASFTDAEIYVPPDYYTMQPPGAGGTYVDPVFGTTIRRLTDTTNRGFSVPEYSQSSSYNLDDTYLVLMRDSGHHLYDGNGNHIQQLGGVSEPRWSRTNPHWLYFHAGNQIRRWNVATNQVVTIRSFSSSINFGNATGDVADNDRIVVLRDNRYISIWDLVNGTRVSGQELDTQVFSAGFDFATITKDGNSFVVGYHADGGSRGAGLEQYDVDGNFVVQLLNDAPHAAMGRDLDGSPVVFVTNAGTNPQQPAGCNAGIVKVSLDGAARRTCLLPIPWGMDVHLSGHGNDGWVYLSTFRPGAQPVAAEPETYNANDAYWHVYNGEIIRVRADGSLVERLAHHRSRGDSYWIQPHANISISGNKLVYGSDFQLDAGYGYADTYVVDLVPGAETAPAPPSTLQSAGFPDPRIDLSWTDNSDNEDAFEVLRQGPGESFYRFVAYLGSGATSYQDFGVTLGDSYCYQVVAHNGTGASVPSNSSCATPASAPAPPAAPTGLQSTGFPDPLVDLSWVDNSLEETSFDVRRQGPNETYYSSIATVSADETSYRDTSVSSDIQFCYQVVARNAMGDSEPTGISCATPPAPEPPPAEPTLPPAPTSLSAEWSGRRRITLSWLDNAENETSFLIYRRRGDGRYRRIGQVGADVTTFTDTRVRSGRWYCYRVFAGNDAGWSVSNKACIRG